MTKRSEEQAASETHADMDDQASIEAELDKLEALVRAARDPKLRSATSTLGSDRWH